MRRRVAILHRILFAFNRNYCDPLSVTFVVVRDGSAKLPRNLFGWQITMVAGEVFLDALPRVPRRQERVRRLIFWREDQGDVESVANHPGQLDLRSREVLDA